MPRQSKNMSMAMQNMAESPPKISVNYPSIVRSLVLELIILRL